MSNGSMDLTHEWVNFVRVEDRSGGRPNNPVMGHFLTSFKSMKTTFSSFDPRRTFKKAFSFPRSRAEPENSAAKPGTSKTVCLGSVSTLEDEIYEFLQEIKNEGLLERKMEESRFSVYEGRHLLDIYKQKFQKTLPVLP